MMPRGGGRTTHAAGARKKKGARPQSAPGRGGSRVQWAERDDNRDYGAHAQDMLDTRHAHPLQGGAVAEEEKEEAVTRRQRVVARRVGGKTVFETQDVPMEG